MATALCLAIAAGSIAPAAAQSAGGPAASATPTAPVPDAGDEAEAKRLYQEGTKSFSLAEYGDAITAYRAAYKRVPKPLFLFDIAQAYRLMGDFKQSLIFYKSYLVNLPAGAKPDDVLQLIKEMEDEIAKHSQTIAAPPHGPAAPEGNVRPVPSPTDAAHAHAETPRPAPLPPVPPPHGDAALASPPIYKRWWFWVGLTAAAGAVTAGVVASRASNGAPSTDLGTTPIF